MIPALYMKSLNLSVDSNVLFLLEFDISEVLLAWMLHMPVVALPLFVFPHTFSVCL